MRKQLLALALALALLTVSGCGGGGTGYQPEPSVSSSGSSASGSELPPDISLPPEFPLPSEEQEPKSERTHTVWEAPFDYLEKSVTLTGIVTKSPYEDGGRLVFQMEDERDKLYQTVAVCTEQPDVQERDVVEVQGTVLDFEEDCLEDGNWTVRLVVDAAEVKVVQPAEETILQAVPGIAPDDMLMAGAPSIVQASYGTSAQQTIEDVTITLTSAQMGIGDSVFWFHIENKSKQAVSLNGLYSFCEKEERRYPVRDRSDQYGTNDPIPAGREGDWTIAFSDVSAAPVDVTVIGQFGSTGDAGAWTFELPATEVAGFR